MIYQNAKIKKTLTTSINYNIYSKLPENTVGEKIRKMRIKSKLSQEQLGNLINASRGTINTYEHNEAYPSPKRLIALANALKTDIKYFYDEYYTFIFSDFKDVLKNFRLKNNLSIRDLKKYDISPDTWHDWENGILMNRVSYEKVKGILYSEL